MLFGFDKKQIIVLIYFVVGSIAIGILRKTFAWNKFVLLLTVLLFYVSFIILVKLYDIIEAAVPSRTYRLNVKSIRSIKRSLGIDPNNEEALNAIRHIVSNDPGNLKAAMLLSSAYFVTSKIKLALDLLDSCQRITNSNKIAKLRERLFSIKYLTLFSPKSEDLEQLKLLPDLKAIRFESVPGNSAYDFSPLAKMPNITSLDLSELFCIDDISTLACLVQLTDLDLSFNDIEDISPLANLIRLTSLNISGNNIKDISPLATLTELKSLNLGFNFEIEDYSPLELLHKLKNVEK